MSQPRNAIVVGMARSGTSMTTAIFHRAGYFVAEDERTELQVADAFNPSGYWEPLELLEANRAVLKAAAFAHDNTWMYDPISEDEVRRIGELEPSEAHRSFYERYESRQPWVWKDPRFCYTLPYWWKLIDPDRTSVLLLTRDRDEIVRSFRRVGWRTDMRLDRLVQCVDQHVSAARTWIAELDVPYIEIDYSEFRSNPGEAASRINEHFGTRIRADALGYRSVHNTSSVRGRLRSGAERVADHVPGWARRLAKSALRR